MNWIGLSLALLLLQTPATQNRASITGFVVKLGTSEPLSKAIVVLDPVEGTRGANQTFSTSNDGRFIFDNVEPGKYRLSASRNGYVQYEYGARASNRRGLPITVTAGQRINQVVLPLMAAGTITGRVYDRDGEPLANVSIQALKYTYQDGQRILNTLQVAQTNDLGEYRLFWLTPGQYFVSAQYLRRGVAGRRITLTGPGGIPGEEEGYVPIYYPGTIDSQSAAPINLPAGVVFSGVDLTLAPVRTGRLRVQIFDGSNGQPVSRQTRVAVVPRRPDRANGARLGNLMGQNVIDQGQGIFEVRDLVPGSYDVVASMNDNRRTARTVVEVNNTEVQTVTLVLSPGFTVPGRLAAEGGLSSSNLRVILRPDITQVTGGGPREIRVEVQKEGTFTLQPVGQETYQVTVAGLPRNGYVKMARLGAIDVLNEGLRLDRPPTGPLEILVSTNTGTVDAVVTDERHEPAINVTVVLVPDPTHRDRADLYKFATTDAAGRTRFEGVPPGDYKAFAWEDVEYGAWQDSDFIRLYEERGRPVRVGENGQTNVELRITSP